MHKSATEAKGIFCLEGDWWNDLKHSTSTESALRLLKEYPPRYTPYIHRDVGTRAEFDYYVRKWLQVAHAGYPILYLAFHGTPGTIEFGSLSKQENIVSLDELEQSLSGRCNGRIVYFSSCGTMGENGNRLRRFLRRTQALAVCGYRSDVDWLNSVAFDLLFLGQAQFYAFTSAGMHAVERQILEKAGGLSKKIGFRMVIHDR